MVLTGFNLNQISGLSYNQRLIERPELFSFLVKKKIDFFEEPESCFCSFSEKIVLSA